MDVSIFVVGDIAGVRGDARTNLEVLGHLGHTIVEINDSPAWELHFSEIRSCDLLVDAMFGTGLKTPLSGLFETIVADINASDLAVVSVDLPSGLSADTPEPIGPCVDATMTVTLGAPKLPLLLPPGEGHCGDVVIADIGIPEAAIEAVEGPHLELLTRDIVRGADRATTRRLAQGRLRPRAGRGRRTRQDRRRASVGDGRAQVGRGAGHDRDDRGRASRSWRRWRRNT